MAFSGSLTSSLALQPPAGRSRQLQIPARTSRQGLSSNHTTAARVEEVLFKRPDVPADWSDSDAKQQRRFASASQQTSGKVAAHPRSALEQVTQALIPWTVWLSLPLWLASPTMHLVGHRSLIASAKLIKPL